ncbi:MAG: hypothetical protein KKE20_01940 [Nanoarchaeota archaeon]|nr:hypothetical protein [Nanoarchaeota archaeon]
MADNQGGLEKLVDFLSLENYKPKTIYTLRDWIEQGLKKKYGFEESLVSFKKIQMDSCRNSVRFELPLLEYLYSIGKHIPEVQERMANATDEDIEEAMQIFTERARRYNPEEYYSNAVKVYYQMMSHYDEMSKAANVMERIIKPLFLNQSSEGVLSRREIAALLGKDRFDEVLLNLPTRYVRMLNEITAIDVDAMITEIKEYDKNRNMLHKEILEYGKKHFGKDYIDVFMDIMSHERLKGEGYLHLSVPDKKKGYLVLDIGYISIPTGSSSEFSRGYGEEYEDEFFGNMVKRAHESLKRARQDGEGSRRIEYGSEIDRERTEEEDNALLERVKEEFKEYVSFTGDYLIKNMHGHYVFRKVLEIDVNKIREKENDPALKIEEIKTFIESLLPKEEEFEGLE